jgi:hypothetical protein
LGCGLPIFGIGGGDGLLLGSGAVIADFILERAAYSPHTFVGIAQHLRLYRHRLPLIEKRAVMGFTFFLIVPSNLQLSAHLNLKGASSTPALRLFSRLILQLETLDWSATKENPYVWDLAHLYL